MALTIALNLGEARWGDLRKYVEMNRDIPDTAPVTHSATNAAGEIDPELYEEVESG